MDTSSQSLLPISTNPSFVSKNDANGVVEPPTQYRRTRRRKRIRRRWSLCLSIILVIVTILRVVRHRNMKSFSPTTKSLIQPDAIVTLATNNFRSTLISNTLRNIGGWNKPIFVFTDDPDSESQNDVTPVDIRQHHPGFLSDAEFRAYKENHDSNQYYPWVKWHKTQLFDMLPDSVEVVLFLDSDIVVQTPLDKFWHQVQPLIRQKSNCDISLYPERWYTNSILSKYSDSGLWNSGIMLVRRSAQPLLRKWGRRIVTEPFMKRDQPKLTKVIRETPEVSVCSLPHRMDHVMYQPDIVDRLGRFMGKTTTFRHFASAKVVSVLSGKTYDDE